MSGSRCCGYWTLRSWTGLFAFFRREPKAQVGSAVPATGRQPDCIAPAHRLTAGGCAAALTACAQTSRIAVPAVSYDLDLLESWDGYCLPVPSGTAGVGTRLDQAPCSSAHNWWRDDLTGDVYLSGHANLQIGDSGGYLELKAAGTGTIVNWDAGNAKGTQPYFELYFQVPDTYWHANGNGQYVTFDNVAGDLANYWAFVAN
jgi:hypothetical protein